MTNETDDQPAYQTQAADGRFEVRSASGKCMVVCRDEDSAGHYAVLLNEAYQAGFRQGFRQASRQ